MASERSKKIASENDRNRESKFMNGNQPYRQDNDWNDLPLPGQEESWAKMEALLDKEEKRRIIPPFFLNCAGIALFGAVIIAAAWFAFRPGGWLNENSVATTEKKDHTVQTVPGNSATNQRVIVPEKKTGENSLGVTKENNSEGSAVTSTTKKTGNFYSNQKTYQRNAVNSPVTTSLTKGKTFSAGPSTKKNVAQSLKTDKATDVAKAKTADKIIEDAIPGLKITQPGKSIPPVVDQKDSTTKISSVENKANAPNNVQLVVGEPTVSDTAKMNSTTTVTKETSNNKPSRFSFSAGLGIQQQLRSGTQLAYGSDYYGKKGVFSEHIPSVYFRVHHKDNWFAQAEFRFGAPQLVKDYSYARKIKYDTSADNLVVSTMRLRKLYYHQLPFSFNYNVLPRLSVGTGGVYSIFYRAVTEQEVKATNISTGAESYSKITQRIPGFRDSFFFKSQVQFILNTDYRWKNFSIGLRYKKDLQPYIKYTKPDGTLDEDMNDAIEVILRYRLWKSKR
jgi:hypothetical protein